jgi:hypothetical protein
LLRIHRVTVRVGWISLAVGVPTLVALPCLPWVPTAAMPGAPVVTVTAGVVGLMGLILSFSCLWTAGRIGWPQAVGAAAQALRPRLGGADAGALGRALRALDSFDAWSAHAGVRLEPSASAGEPWTPQDRITLSAPTASRALLVVYCLLAIPFVAAMAMGVGGVATPYGPGHSAAPYLWALGTGAVAFVVSVAVFFARDRVEYRAGYTTRPAFSRSVPRDPRTALDLVDSKTGIVLRRAGDEGLTRDEYWRRRTIAQERG